LTLVYSMYPRHDLCGRKHLLIDNQWLQQRTHSRKISRLSSISIKTTFILGNLTDNFWILIAQSDSRAVTESRIKKLWRLRQTTEEIVFRDTRGDTAHIEISSLVEKTWREPRANRRFSRHQIYRAPIVRHAIPRANVLGLYK